MEREPAIIGAVALQKADQEDPPPQSVARPVVFQPAGRGAIGRSACRDSVASVSRASDKVICG